MPFTKINIHAVWGTKSRYPFLTPEIKSKVIHHIKENAKKKNIKIVSINGYFDHIHCLLGLPLELSIAKAMQLIKGESSFWINQQKLTSRKFEWCDEYYAESIGPSDMERVKNYILNQEEHHRKKTFSEEVDRFLKNYHHEG